MTAAPEGIRLNKFISDSGACSRREADRLIEEGLVRINGRIAEIGVRVVAGDSVSVRGKLLKANPKAVYLAYNKPAGITSTTDQAVAGNIVDAVNYRKGRIFPIGRLDKPSEGLILLTNDGNIVNKILRAGNAHEKEYVVSVDKPINPEFLARMAAGVPILDTVTQPCKIRQLSAKSFNIILTQGMNRQIRRMTEYLGYNVVRLKRVRVMNVRLDGIQSGQWRELTAEEMQVIDSMLGESSKTEEASAVLGKQKAGKRVPRKQASGKPPRKKPVRSNKSVGTGKPRKAGGPRKQRR